MEAERWRRIEELCQAALEQPPEKRAALLAQACADDSQLRGEVQSLLAQQADSFLESEPVSAIRALSAGARLGNFEVVELLGRGGMGEVWRARDARLKRDVAIKVLPPGLARDPDRIARFEREARAASALNHHNIVTVYDIGRDGATYWIASELVRGETLRRMIEAGPLPSPKAIEIAVQVAVGLAAAHAAGLVHRDLKPDNIMVTRDSQVKILDFGLAKQRRTAQDSTTIDLTDEGVVLGTAGYMSPEQVRGEATDHRSDLFSFGVVFYEMLCGKRAFAGNSSVEVMNAVLKDEPPELPASVPVPLGRIVRRCLEKDRELRFRSAADLGFALEALSLAPARVEQPKRRMRWKWAALASAAVTLGAVYWLGVRPPKRSAPPETTLRRLTNEPGITNDATISPDGKLVAYVRNGDIWVQQIDGSGLIRITDNPAGNSGPEFSPDGMQVAFRSERAGGAIYIAPALGGEARELVPQGRRPRFSPDGRWLMYWIGPAIPGDLRGSTQVNLFVQPVSGGAPTQIASGCGLMERTPVWSPDGSRILFVGSCGSDVATVWVCAVDGKDVRPNRDLYAFWREIHSQPVIDQWVADPPRALIPLRVGDATYVTAVPISADGTKVTGPSQRLASLTDDLTRASAAFNGRMVLSVSASTSHIWSLPINARGQATGEPKQLTYGTAGELRPSLSRDGEKVAFTSVRANGIRLFYRDLATGREKELSTDGYRYETPMFNPNGTGIMYVKYPDRESVRDFMYYVALSGGLAKKVWDKSWSWLWDWAPDGKTLLLLTYADRPRERTFIRQLDLDSLSATTFLDDPKSELWQAHFSHDGRWVTFNATRNKQESRIYAVPFRKALMPRSEWVAITDGGSDDKPRFSNDDKLLFFRSDRDGSRRIWAQKLRPDMRPAGTPIAVYPLGQNKSSPVVSDDEIGVGPQRIVFTQVETAGNIWLLEPAKRDAH